MNNMSVSRTSKRILDDYKEVLNDIVGKFNKNAIESLHKTRPTSVCPDYISDYR